jgi:aromatic-L-amino-acid/L-tryptophan decarboxylase
MERVTPRKSRSEIASLFDEPLPEEPQEMPTILREVEEHVFGYSTLYSNPRFFGYMNGSGNQAAVLGELLAAAVNQICAKWQFSQEASEVERRVIQWVAQFVGYGSDAGGCLLNGGSAGNFAGLAVARHQKAPFDANTLGRLSAHRVRVAGGARVSAWAVVSCAGSRSSTTSPWISRRLRSRSRQIGRTGITRSALGNAGTVNTGAVDPLAALAEFCRTQGLWFHVDDPQLARVGASDSRRLGLKQLSARVRTVHSSRGASAR